MKRRLLALLLVLTMVVSLVPEWAFAATKYTTLAFTSDVHNASDNQSADRLSTWIDTVTGMVGNFNYMGFCGDMATATGSSSETEYWKYAKAVIDVVTEKGIPASYTTGNHEMENGAFNTTSNAVKNYFTVNAVPANVPANADYRIYCLGSVTSQNTYTTEQIEALRAYLNNVDNSKPIFILTHFPLHSYTGNGQRRQTTNADQVIDELNNAAGEGKTIVLLWGHNHTLSDTYYDEVYKPGRSLSYNTSGATKTIQFYYAAAGCMSDSEYSSGSNSVKGKGLIVQIGEDGSLRFGYCNAAGDDVTEGGGSLILQPIDLEGVSLDKEEATVKVGRSIKLTPVFTPRNATNKNVTWSSSNPEIATVDENGKVKGIAEGQATVTVTTEEGAFSASCEITVIPGPAQDQAYVITIDGYALSTERSTDQLINNGGNTQRFYYHGLKGVKHDPGDAATNKIRWILEETDGGYYIMSLDGLYLNATYLQNSTGGYTGDLHLDDTPDVWVLDSTVEDWEVDGSRLYSTNAKKYMTYEEGTTASPLNLFTVRTNGETSYLSEAIDPIAATGVVVEPAEATVEVWKTITLSATVLPENATEKEVHWSSDDTSVATVDSSGKVKGVSAGTCTITAVTEDGGFSAGCQVTVIPNPDADKTYVITIQGFALSTERSPDELVNNGGNTQRYRYHGLKGIEYTSEVAEDPPENIRWILMPADGGYYIMSLDGLYLNATYLSNETGGKTGEINLNDTPDVWKINGSLEDWQIDGSTLLSSNANKYMTHEETTPSGASINLFTVRSNGETSELNDPEKMVATRYIETDKLEADKEYIIAVTKDNGSVYAIRNQASGTAVTETGIATLGVFAASGEDPAFIETDDENVVWKYTAQQYLSNNSLYLGYQSSSFALSASGSGSTVTYNGGKLLFTNGSRYVTFSGTSFAADANSSAAAADIRLFVKTKEIVPRQYTVSFIDSLTNEVISVQKVEEGGKPVQPEDPEKEGWTFSGWYDSADSAGTLFDFSKTVTKSTSVYAVWSKTLSSRWYDLSTGTMYAGGSFTINGTSAGQSESTTFMSRDNMTLELAAVPAEKYQFKGWALLPDDAAVPSASTEIFSASANLSFDLSAAESVHVVLCALFEREDITVTFKANGGAGADVTQKIPYGSSAALKANGFTYKSHEFVGWAEQANASAAKYTDGQTVKLEDDITLYAVWGGYYLIGSLTGGKISEAYVMSPNEEIPGEYLLETTIEAGSEIKVAYAVGGVAREYYPSSEHHLYNDMTGYYTVAPNYAGNVIIYFKPAGDNSADWKTFGGYFNIVRSYSVQIQVIGGNGKAYSIRDNEHVTEFLVLKQTNIEITCEPDEDYELDRIELYKNNASSSEGEILSGTSFVMPDDDVVVKVYFKALVWTFTNFTWTGNEGSGFTAKANYTCESQPALTKTVTATVTSAITKAATCEETGVRTYTATLAAEASPDGKAHTDTKTTVIPATGHSWGEVTYTWSADNTSVTAKRVCANDTSHVESETVNATYAVTTAATCEKAGEGTWTSAGFTNKAFTVQTKKVVIPATGHDWGEPVYTWSSNNSRVTARMTCKNDSSHTVTETVTATYAVTTPATCEKDGVGTWTSASFRNSAFTVQTKTVVIKATGHNWGEPTYTWSADNSSVTAKRVCANDASHVETETVNTTLEVTKQPTCEEKGETTYTATFENDAFKEQTKTVANIDATGHNWGEVTYTWSADNTSVTAKRVCGNDSTHTETETVTATYAVTTPATCEKDGVGTWTSEAFTKEAFKVQTKTVVIKATGHNWGEPTYTWSNDYSKVTATRVCANDATHVESETVNATAKVTKQPTCEEKGETTYTATFENDAFKEQTKTVANIDATGHNWGEVTYTWSADNTSVTAKRVCGNDSSHTETETVTATYAVTTPATCEKDGVGTWTSEAFTKEAFKVQTKTVVIKATGHNWGEPTYTWSDDYSKVTAKRVCANDASHVETETVNTTAKVIKQPTCEEKGETTYTAKFSNPVFETQTKTVANISATGHNWGEPTYTWSADNTSVTAKRVCGNDSTHTETETVKATYAVTTPATCEQDGVGTWTSAAFTNPAFTVQTKTVVIKATGHNWGEPTYSWSADNSSVTAKRVCANDASHVESETVNTTAKVTKQPTCEEKGETTYTAKFSNPVFETQTKTVANVDATGHNWGEVTYTWSADNTSVTAKRVCGNDSSHTETETVKATYAVTTPATCEKDGVGTWTSAAFTNEAFKVQTKTVVIKATGHNWNTPTYTWSDDYSKVTATRVCANDASHVETETVNTTAKVTKQPTCEEKGETTYTATFKNEAFKVQTKTVANIDATGHNWGEVTYTWSADNTSVTAKRVCGNDSTHTETETVKATYAVTTPATCEKDGVGTWTSAAFTNEAFKVQTKTVVIKATGHNWNTPTYTWSDDYSKVTATRVCANDASHVETETVNTTATVTKQPTCEEKGETTYTAKFSNAGFEIQTKTIANIDAIGHIWGAPVWNWAKDHSEATAVFTCVNDAAHVSVKTAVVTQEEGTGEDEGYVIYTATVIGPDGETYTDVVKAEITLIDELMRIYGSTRYKTGLAIAEEFKREKGVEKFDNVILATGNGFADALAGSYLAYKKDAPILLIREKDAKLITSYIQENLKENGKVYVLGGETAVPEAWLTGLDGLKVQRVCGETRYLTNLEILKEAGVADGEEVLICTGQNYADSLSASSTGKPLFLVRSKMSTEQKEMLEALKAKGCTFVILGGESAVTPETEALIRGIVGSALEKERLAGSTRHRTSVLVAERYFPEAKSMILAVGSNYPDGLCGGALGAVRKAPIILTSERQKAAAVTYAAKSDIHTGVVLGGSGLLSDELVREILGLDEDAEIIEHYWK